jgi:hypothetical protein
MERKDTRICSKCKYPLHGLARMGKCPECGNAFSVVTGEGVEYPASLLERADRFGMRLKTGLLCAGLVIMINCMGFNAWFNTPGRTFWWVTGVITAFIALMLVDSLLDQFKKKSDW